MSEYEFLRWYWLKAELETFAREIAVRATGNKELLTARIGAALAGRRFEEPMPTRRAQGRQLSAPLSHTTVIPVGQRSSQVVRAWMLEKLGPSFHFDAEVRDFFVQSDGTTTMQDALDHFHATRNQGSKSIDSQFEYNRFTRGWHKKYPDGSRDELLADWRAYRDTPIDRRGRI
ncbi:hypothetical protein CQ018_13025 [Arthrobacter sp. MYb227]|nr:hypothetical protein CQ018_13025 [Arthrobacter sp. MYb227]